MFELVQNLSIDGPVARGRAVIAAEHPFLSDHFPGAPLLPGTLGVELLAQIAGPLVESRRTGELAVLSMIKSARFLLPVPLPATLDLACEVARDEASGVHVVGSATRDGEAVLRAELYLALVPERRAPEAARLARRERLRRWGAVC